MKNWYKTKEKARRFAWALSMVMFPCFMAAQSHGWTVNPAGYSFNGEVTAVVFLGPAEVTTGTLGAFVGDTCRGYADGEYFPPTGKTVFIVICYSNENSGEILNFKYYDPAGDSIYNVNETLEFVSDMTIGDAASPELFHITLNSPPVVTNPVGDLDLDEHFGTHTIDLATVFSDPDGPSATYSAVSSNTGVVTVSVAGPVLTITEAGIGTSTVTATLDDGEFSVDDVFTVTVTDVNEPPVVSDIPDQTRSEGGVFATITLDDYVTDADHADDEITWTYSGNTGLSVSIASRVATVSIPDADWNGSETITFTATDPLLATGSDAAIFTVTAVNDAPSFTRGSDQSVAEDAGSQTAAGWATAVSAGPADESGQVLTFNLSNDNNGLFAVQPAVAPDGTLTYTPATDANGSAQVTVSLSDDGGTANGGVDTSPDQTFTITVTAVNDAPSFTRGSDQSVSEDAGLQTTAGWATAVSAGPADESGQVLTFNLSNDNNGLFSVQPAVAPDGTLTYTPAADANGSAQVTVSLSDDGGTANGGVDTSPGQTFTITVTPVNDPPVVGDIPGQTVAEGGSFNTITLDNYVSDVDNSDSEITWTFAGNTDLTVSIVSRVATISIPDTDWNGNETITFTATDPLSGTDSDDAIFEVTPVNDAPVAGNVAISGNITVGNVITGGYTYSDAEGDPEGSSVFNWYRSDDASGAGQAVISGATAITYTLVSADEGKYIGFEVTPVAQTGASPGLAVMSPRLGPVGNAVPVASDVSVTGTFIVGNTLTAGYTYSDPENNPEGTSLYRWYRSDDLSGANEILLPGASTLNYTLVPADENKYIRFEVTPVAASGSSPGAVATSPRYGPVANSVPYVTNVTITGTLAVGSPVTGNYTYQDREGDPEGSSVYTWYRSDNTSGLNETQIPGADAITYTPLETEDGKYLRFAVTPVAQSGNSPGLTVYSPYSGPVQSTRPTASIAGNYTICDDGSTANLSINLTGHAPWSIVYQRDGANDVPVSGITANPYSFAVSLAGTYTVSSVSDSYYATGTTSGSAVVSYYTNPTATISGNATICNDGSRTPITVSLTGTAPWKIVYQRDGVGPVTVQNILSSPYVFDVASSGTYTLVSVDDSHCSGTVSGSAVVSYHTTPTATLSGTASICAGGSSTPLSIDFTGSAPWTVTYQKDSQNPITFNNITENPFIFYVNQAGTYRLVSVHDLNCSGTVSGTANIYILPLPTALISGTATICPDAGTDLRFDLTGIPPWSVTYLRNGTNPRVLTNITASPYFHTVTGDGSYTLQAVSDNNCTGTVSGTATVSYWARPEATLSGAYSICEGDTARVPLLLEGTPPWNVTILRDGTAYTNLSAVTASTTMLALTEAGVYTVGQVTDLYCTGTVAGSATVTVNPLPVVSITGLNPVYNVNSDPVPLTATPAGGVFRGPGVVTSPTNLFYPDIAGTENSPHNIIYDYTSIYGCKNSDTAVVIVTSADGEIVIPKPVYCSYDAPFTITGYNTAGAIGIFSITGGAGLTNLGNNTAQIDPQQVTPGDHVITYAYFDGDTFRLQKDLKIEEVGPASFIDFTTNGLCRNDLKVELKGNTPSGNYTTGQGVFSGNGVTGSAGTGYYFNPGLAQTGDNNITYTFTTSNGCKQTASKIVRVYQLPETAFAISDTCIQPGSAVSFLNNTVSADAVDLWEWNFGDPASGPLNTSNLEDPAHQYTTFGIKSVRLVARTNRDCYDTLISSVKVFEKPVAQFIWLRDCYDELQPNEFLNLTTTQTALASSTWTIRNAGGSVISAQETEHLNFSFPGAGTYTVELSAKSLNGCVDVITKEYILNPLINFSAGEYSEDFEGSSVPWYAQPAAGVNSWAVDVPAGTVLDHASSGVKAWITNPSGNYTDNESSWVTGPCFDFAGLSRPMITLRIWPHIDDPDDGVTLEYTVDGGNTWAKIGKAADEQALNWYNASAISQLQDGWNGNSASDWTEARHDLDELAGRGNVRFRLRFVSDAAGVSEGFAFDDIRIGERSRRVMLEHYTNISDPNSEAADNYVNAWAAKDTSGTAVVQYHTAFPGADPLFSFYPAGPSARTVYYGISEVPYTRMDGIRGFSGGNLYQLDTNAVIRRSLTDPLVDISVTAEVTGTGALTADVNVKSRGTLAGTHQYVLHVLLIEKAVEAGGKTYKYVLRKMLPDEGGIVLNELLTNGFMDVNLNLNVNVQAINPAGLSLVAFVQDENTREICQSLMLKKVNLASGIIPVTTGNNLTFAIYPNPATDQLTIEFGEVPGRDTRVQVFNEYGQIIETFEMQKGEVMVVRDLKSYVKGIYFVRVISENGLTGVGRFVVIN